MCSPKDKIQTEWECDGKKMTSFLCSTCTDDTMAHVGDQRTDGFQLQTNFILTKTVTQFELQKQKSCAASCLVHTSFWLGLLFRSEDGGDVFTARHLTFIELYKPLHSQGLRPSDPTEAPAVSLNEQVSLSCRQPSRLICTPHGMGPNVSSCVNPSHWRAHLTVEMTSILHYENSGVPHYSFRWFLGRSATSSFQHF